ncbi:MAG: host attachment protein [Proteobacteria bacterium]|nr:host attachment protein [Pseudomonadota bacterium]
MRTRIIVADQSEACFYDLQHRPESLRLVLKLTDPKAHLHDRDFNSDRPGRVFDHAPTIGKRRGATAHHATGGERSPRRHEADLFARQIAAELDQGLRRNEFESIILVAGPPFLGILRHALPHSLTAIVAAEVTKDLVHHSVRAVIDHLPPQPFGLPASGQ